MMYEWMSGSFMRLILSAPIRLLLMSVLGKGACACVCACVCMLVLSTAWSL